MKEALEFVKALKSNNDRDWFNANKAWFQKSSDDFKSYVALLIAGIKELDDSIGSVEPKDCIFRIYRDVRFSHDKAPYKSNFGAYIAKGGRKSPYAGYYFHMESDGSFASGGIYMAPNDVMKRIREDIDIYSDDFLAIVNDKKFAQTFQFFEDEKLKRVPNGFDKDSPAAEFLKFKHITPFHSLSNDDIVDKNLLKNTLEVYKTMKPLVDFLNRSIRGLKDE